MPQNHESGELTNITNLRKNIYSVVDEVVATGQPFYFERKGIRLAISIEGDTTPKLDKLFQRGERSVIVGDEAGFESESVYQWEPDRGFD